MRYDFDTIIERRGSGDLKHEALLPRWGRDDLLPLWVADMDFATPPFITNALKKRLEHPIFGYTADPPELWPTIIEWIRSHHDWQIEQSWLTFVPGVVKGIGFAVNVFCRPDEKVIIQPPVYHPFRLTPQGNGREVVENPLLLRTDGRYEMDFEGLERVADAKCRLLILSNPHNPGGVCWDEDTLRRLARFCAERKIVVVSDEIHCDLTLPGHRHVPFATVSDEAAQWSITLQAPSKTFNIAGLVSSYAIVPNEELRRPFYRWLHANELDEPTLFAPIATLAAYRYGEEWRQQMLHYVEGNIDFVEDYCRAHLPLIRPMRPDASFLVWLDCRPTGLDHRQLLHLFIDEAHLALNDGAIFGTGGTGFMRLNVGTPRSVLRQALDQLRQAYEARGLNKE